jgi:hypothetical protein
MSAAVQGDAFTEQSCRVVAEGFRDLMELNHVHPTSARCCEANRTPDFILPSGFQPNSDWRIVNR